jgi:hypothetical protein
MHSSRLVASHWTRSKETVDFRGVAGVGDSVTRSWQVAAFQLQKQTTRIVQKRKLTIAFQCILQADTMRLIQRL